MFQRADKLLVRPLQLLVRPLEIRSGRTLGKILPPEGIELTILGLQDQCAATVPRRHLKLEQILDDDMDKRRKDKKKIVPSTGFEPGTLELPD